MQPVSGGEVGRLAEDVATPPSTGLFLPEGLGELQPR